MKYSSRGKNAGLTLTAPPAGGRRSARPPQRAERAARSATRMPAAASDSADGRPPPSAPLSISSRYQSIVSVSVRSSARER